MDEVEKARIVGTIEAVDQYGATHALTVIAGPPRKEPPYKPGEGTACIMGDGSPLRILSKGKYATIGTRTQLILTSEDPASPGVFRYRS